MEKNQSDKMDLRVKRTLALIDSTVKEMINEMPPEKISVRELTERAGIHRKTFYLHYGSIAELYNDLGNMIVTLIKKEIIDYSTNNKTPYELFVNINDIINEKIDLFKDIAKNNDFSDFILRIKDILSEELINLYGKKNTPASERFKLTTEFIASGTIAMYLKWLKGDANITMDELALLAAEMITNGASGLVEII